MNDRIKRLQQEAEAIRQEGFVAGWDAAMETILKATRAAPPEDNFDTPQPRGGARNPNIMPRGATPLVVSRVLRSVTPRALSPTQIIALAEESGTFLSETGVRRALDKLVAEGEAEQVGDSKSWRALAPGASEDDLKAMGIIPPHARLVRRV